MKKQQNKYKFNSDEFIISRNRIKNIRDFLASDDTIEIESEEKEEFDLLMSKKVSL
jgi:hypothetical protein